MTLTLLIAYLDRRTRRAFAAAQWERLRDQGIRLVLADEDVGEEDRALFADVVEVPPYDRVAEAAAALEKYAARHPIDGILAQSEYGLLPAALLRQKSGGPGISPRAALACTNKWLSRRLLAEAGVPVPRHALATDAAGVRNFAAEAGYPVALKGVASTMGRNVARVSSPHEVDDAVARLQAGMACSPDVRRCSEFARLARLDLECDPWREFLVEEWVGGAAIETDGLVRGRRPETFGVVEQVWTPEPLRYVEGYLLPADPEAVEAEGLLRVSDRALAATGLEDAGFAVELRVERRQEVRVIEVNGRLGEDDGFERLFEAATGVNPLWECLAHLAGKPAATLRPPRPCALAYASCFREGVVGQVPGEDERRAAQQREGCLELRVVVEPGTRMHAPPHPDVFPHVAYALAEDAAGSRAAYARARGAVAALEVRVG